MGRTSLLMLLAIHALQALDAVHALPGPPTPPAWPARYVADVTLRGPFQHYDCRAFFDLAAGLERFDYAASPTASDGVARVIRINNFTQRTHVTLTERTNASYTCLSMPMRVLHEMPVSPFEHLAAAEYVDNTSVIDGQAAWRYLVPLYEQRLWCDYYVAQATGLPLRIASRILRVTFANISTAPFESLDVFRVPDDVAATCAGPLPQQPVAVPGTGWSAAAAVDETLDPLLWPNATTGYLGGDGGQSTVLPGGRVAVASDDLFFGVRLHGAKLWLHGMVHNILQVWSGPGMLSADPLPAASVTYAAQWGSNSVSDFVKPFNWSASAHYLWLGRGLVVPDGGSDGSGRRMLMVTQEMRNTDGKTARPVVVHFHGVEEENPAAWRVTIDTHTAFTQHEWDHTRLQPNNAGSVLLSTTEDGTPDGFAYISGNKPSPVSIDRVFFLSRLPLQDLVDGRWNRTEYLLHDGSWSHDFSNSTGRHLFNSTAPCSMLTYHPQLRLYFALTTDGSDWIGIAVARNATGPYHEQRKVYRIPPAISDGYMPYCPAPHLQWSPNNRTIVFTYFENTFGASLRCTTSSLFYEARFVRVELDGTW